DPPQQGVRAGGQAQRPRQPGAGLTTQGVSDEALGVLEASGRARGDGDEFGEPLGEGLAGASGHGAGEPADEEHDADGSALPGKVGQRPGVPTVDARRGQATAGARSGGGDGLNGQGDRLSVGGYVLECQANGLGEQGGQRQPRTPIATSNRFWTYVDSPL